MKIIIATNNKDKCQEILSECNNPNISLHTLDEYPMIGDIKEIGTTLKENALIKAKEVYNITGIPTIADDTGLEVDSLDGAPGVYSARFAGENCSYSDNVSKMLEVMKKVEKNKRTAIFKTIMAFVDGDEELFSEGIVKGVISEKIKGLAGFGYDPIFYVLEEGKTFAEMTLEMKNNISHRGKAVKNLKPTLISYINKKKIKESA